MNAESVGRVDRSALAARTVGVAIRDFYVLITAQMIVRARLAPLLRFSAEQRLVSVQQPRLVFRVHYFVMEYIEDGLTEGVTGRRMVAGDDVAAGQRRVNGCGFLRLPELLRIDRPFLIK